MPIYIDVNMKKQALFYLILIHIWALLAMGCAGPTSPFGGLDLGSGDGHINQIVGVLDQSSANISPSRQVLHDTSDLNLEIRSAQNRIEELELRVVYNDRDVTHAFTRHMGVGEWDKGVAKFSYSDLRLLPTKKHEIEFYFRKSKDHEYSKVDYLPPTCSMKTENSISNTGTFSPSQSVMEKIKSKAKKYNVNPTFLLGLIAQESGFNEGAVSPSRALGLTQVTPLAAVEVQKFRSEWKRHEKFDDESPSVIKNMIRDKKVTATQDWRLNNDRSIEGGLLYLQYLENYWALETNAEILKQRPKINYGSVILASYNSGAARVKNQILQAGDKWLEQPKLKEAFRYVSRIQSYCYHFAKETP